MGLDAFQEDVARIALASAGTHGFALAGGTPSSPPAVATNRRSPAPNPKSIAKAAYPRALPQVPPTTASAFGDSGCGRLKVQPQTRQ